MKFAVLAGLLLLPTLVHAQSQKDMILQLQRDMAAMQEKVRDIEKTQNEKFAAITENLRTTLDQLTKINAELLAFRSNMNEKVTDISKQVSGPLSGVGSKIDQMADQFQGLSNSIADLNQRIGKLEMKVVDLQNTVKTLGQTPPPPGGAPATPGAQASAEKLYDDAYRDYLAGNFDVSIQGFQEYVKQFPTTQKAADAQFFIGEVYTSKSDFESAIKAYDAVIEKYSDSTRVPSAHYNKGVALYKVGRRTDATKEFRTVAEKYPSHELAAGAKNYLRLLGVPVSQAPAAKKAAAPRRR
jgi:tol-pal system protein YbgF